MTPTNSIYLCKAAVFSLLSNAAALSDVQVHWGRPNRDHDVHDNIYVTDSSSDEAFAQLANRKPAALDKEVTVTVEVDVYRDGVDAQGTEEAMWDLVEAVHAVISTDQNLQDVAWKARVASIEQTNPPYEGARLASAVMRIEASVRTRAT